MPRYNDHAITSTVDYANSFNTNPVSATSTALASAAIDMAIHMRGGVNPKLAEQIKEITDEIKNVASPSYEHLPSRAQMLAIENHMAAYTKRLNILQGKASLEEMTELLSQNNCILSRMARAMGFDTALDEQEIAALEQSIAQRKTVQTARANTRLLAEANTDEALTEVASLFDQHELAKPSALKNNKGFSRILQTEPQNTQFAVNIYNCDATTPSVAALTNGGFVVTLLTDDLSGYARTLYGQIYNADGSVHGSVFRISTATYSLLSNPYVAALTNGSFVVAWGNHESDGSGAGVYGQKYNADGSKKSSEFQVNSYTNRDQWHPSIAALTNGGFVVTWQSDGQDGSGYGIYGQIYNADGSKKGSELQVNSYTNRDQLLPSVAALTNGGFVVTWQSDGQDGSSYGIYGQIYNADGSKKGSEFQVNTYTNNDQTASSVAALTNGGFVVTWKSHGQNDPNFGIYGQRYNADGSKKGSAFLVNSYTNRDGFIPSIAALTNDGFVVTWKNYVQDGPVNGWGIYGQVYNTDGSKQDDNFQISSISDTIPSPPSIAALTDGGFVITWEWVTVIRGQRFDSNGQKVGIDGRALPIPSSTPTQNSTPSYTSSYNPTTSQIPSAQSLSFFASMANIIYLATGSIAVSLFFYYVWQCCMQSKWAKARENYILANRIYTLLQLNTPNFESGKGADFLAGIIAIEKALSAKGVDFDLLSDETIKIMAELIATRLRLEPGITSVACSKKYRLINSDLAPYATKVASVVAPEILSIIGHTNPMKKHDVSKASSRTAKPAVAVSIDPENGETMDDEEKKSEESAIASHHDSTAFASHHASDHHSADLKAAHILHLKDLGIVSLPKNRTVLTVAQRRRLDEIKSALIANC